MGKSTPSAPAAPDPVATANAQASANKDAAITQANLNRINQVTPQGSINYSQTGTNSDGTPQYTQTQTYSPEQQALYNQQNSIAQSLGSLAQNNVQRVADAQSQPFNFDGMQALSTGTPAGAIQSTYGQGGPLQSNVQGGNIQSQIANAGNVQTNLNLASFNPGDFNQAAQQASNSAYAAAAARLDPQYAQAQSDLTSRLANSGISAGSDAYNREMNNLAMQKTDAYGQAQNNAYAAGLAAQNQGYTQSLNTQQQNVNQQTTSGNFANAAQGQVFGQNAQQLAANNSAQDQQFQQGQQNAALNNSAQSQQYQQNAANAAFANQAQAQQFNQGQAQASLNNNVRQQQIQEASYLRNLPLNDIASLLGTGGGVQNPTFSNFAQVGVAAPDYQGAVYANYNAANQQYNQALQSQSSGLGSIFGLAGTLGAAAISDRRFKTNIKRIGTLSNGLGTYVFNYIGSKAMQFGVMAQEALKIVPEAVGVTKSGVLYINYAKVWHG